MDATTTIGLAGSAITILSPYLVKGGEAIAQGIGKDLWELVKKPFQSEKDKKIVEDYAKNPQDKELQGVIKYDLKYFLEDNPDMIEKLKKMLPEAEKQMPKINIQIINGDGNIGIQDAHGSNIDIN